MANVPLHFYNAVGTAREQSRDLRQAARDQDKCPKSAVASAAEAPTKICWYFYNAVPTGLMIR